MRQIRTRNLPNTDWFDAVFPINIVHDYMYQLTKFHDQIMIQKMNSKLYLTQLSKLMKWFEILKAEYLTNETWLFDETEKFLNCASKTTSSQFTIF